MGNDPRALARQFFREYKLHRLTLEGLCRVITRQGYTIIEFSQIYNTGNEASLIQALDLTDYIGQSRGFTYVDKNYRLVFVSEDLSEAEKLIVLSHEEGHIFCGHTAPISVVGRDVTEEFEANEFAHYLLKKSDVRGSSLLCRFKAPMLAVAALIITVVLSVGTMSLLESEKHNTGERHSATDYSNYYVTPSGEKYHEAGCKHIKNKSNIRQLTYEELENGAYEPCGDCCPDD